MAFLGGFVVLTISGGIRQSVQLLPVYAAIGAFVLWKQGRSAQKLRKTWNHPVLAGGIVVARNGEEIAAFRLASGDR